MVGEQQVEAAGDGVADDRLHRVDGQQHPAHGGVRIAADQPDGVPRLRPGRRVELLEDAHDVRQAHGHGGEASPAVRLVRGLILAGWPFHCGPAPGLPTLPP